MRWNSLWLTLSCVSLCAAQAPQAVNDVRFEVASVKPADPAASRGRSGGGPGTPDPGLVHYGRITLKGLIAIAYGIDQDLIQGDQWTGVDGFTIDAKVPAGATKDQVPVMLQNLLRDRFHLVLHKEATDLSGYELVVAKGGPKIKKSTGAGTSAAGAGKSEGEPDKPVRMTITKGPEGFPVLQPGLHFQAAYSNGVERASYRDISLAQFARNIGFDMGPP